MSQSEFVVTLSSCILAWEVLGVEDIVDNVDRDVLDFLNPHVIDVLLLAVCSELRLRRCLLVFGASLLLIVIIRGHCLVIELFLWRASVVPPTLPAATYQAFRRLMLVKAFRPVVSLLAEIVWRLTSSGDLLAIMLFYRSWLSRSALLVYSWLFILSPFGCWEQPCVSVDHGQVTILWVRMHHGKGVEKHF